MKEKHRCADRGKEFEIETKIEMNFVKLCSEATVNICTGFDICDNYQPNEQGFFGQKNCLNFMGWKMFTECLQNHMNFTKGYKL